MTFGSTNKILQLTFNSLSFCILIWFAHSSVYDLFISEPYIHYPRIGSFHDIFISGNARFIFDVPTVCSLITLVTSLAGIAASVFIYRIIFSGMRKNSKKYWITQISGIGICIVCILTKLIHFMNTAFGGVG